MQNVNKFTLQLTLAAAALLALPAQAVIVTFDYVVANDGSGKTSRITGADNNPFDFAAGKFVETFDKLDGSGCGVNSPSNLVSITGPGTYGVQTGTTNFAAKPADDKTCFAYGPAQGQPIGRPVTVDFSGMLSLYPGKKMNYLGLYYGSIDNYNGLQFFDGSDTPMVISMLNGAAFGKNTLNGIDILAASGGANGNQFSEKSNIYVNMFFEEGEQFTKFSFISNGIAFEMDNVAAAVAIPEPASMALFGIGLVALTAARRRKKVDL